MVYLDRVLVSWRPWPSIDPSPLGWEKGPNRSTRFYYFFPGKIWCGACKDFETFEPGVNSRVPYERPSFRRDFSQRGPKYSRGPIPRSFGRLQEGIRSSRAPLQRVFHSILGQGAQLLWYSRGVYIAEGGSPNVGSSLPFWRAFTPSF